MVSGGFRPTAPQNNPANVSATGGNGQSGQKTQAPKYISGLPYGQGQATMAQQQAAPMSGGPSTPSLANMLGGGGLNTLLSPTDNPSEPITAGASVGPGPGPEVLPKSITGDIRSQENIQVIAKYIPALVEATKIPDAPDSYKRFVNSLLEQMPQGQAQ